MVRPSKSWRTRVYPLVAVASVSLATCYSVGLVLNRPHWLRGVNWVWGRHVLTLNWQRLILLLATGSVWLVIAAVVQWRRRKEWSIRQVRALLVICALFTPLVQLVVAAQHTPQPLNISFLTTMAPSSGFFQEGVRIDDPVDFIQHRCRSD